jgi:hypothetical protein
MLSPLVSFPSLHQTHFDHVCNQPSVAARSIPRPEPLRLSEHSSEHCHRASPWSSFTRGESDSLSIRSSKSSSSSTISSIDFPIHTPTPSTTNRPPSYTIVHQSKYRKTGESTEESDTTMAPKSGYYDSSRSSSEGERVHYNPRREDRERSAASANKKRTVVVTYGGKTGDPARKAELDGKRWK